MIRSKWLGLVLLLAAGPAWAQSEEEIDAATGKQMEALAHCINTHVDRLAASTDAAPDDVVDQAINACQAERKAWWEQLQKPPLGLAPERAADEVNSALGQVRPKFLDAVKKARS